MTTTLDNRGAQVEISTRAGIDVQFDIGVDDAAGAPLDLAGYTVIAELDDGVARHPLPTELVATDTIRVTIDGALTAALPSVSRYSVELQVPPDGLRASLVYGAVFCDRNYP